MSIIIFVRVIILVFGQLKVQILIFKSIDKYDQLLERYSILITKFLYMKTSTFILLRSITFGLRNELNYSHKIMRSITYLPIYQKIT